MVISSAPIREIESPTLQTFLDSWPGVTDRQLAVDTFWQSIAAQGTPLIEHIDDDLPLVTFLWRGNQKRVTLVEWLSPGDFPSKAMVRIPDTDIWYRSLRMHPEMRSQYQIGPDDSGVAKAEETDWETRRALWCPDPLNPQALVDTGVESDMNQNSVLELPNAPEQRWILRNNDVPTGAVTHHDFHSDGLANDRSVWLYHHPNVDVDDGPTPVIVSFDGERHADVMRIPTTLDNLIAAGEISPCIAVFVGNVERGEELPCNPSFVTMLKDELLPWLAAETGVEIVGDQTLVTGVSYGGLAAMFAGLTEPETFGLVLSQSGSFWWKPDPMNDDERTGIGFAPAYAWLPTWMASQTGSGCRIWMEAGTLESRSFGGHGPSLLDSNRHMRDVLVSKKGDVTYREYVGGHDYACWRGSLAEGLKALFDQALTGEKS